VSTTVVDVSSLPEPLVKVLVMLLSASCVVSNELSTFYVSDVWMYRTLRVVTRLHDARMVLITVKAANLRLLVEYDVDRTAIDSRPERNGSRRWPHSTW
jgi:hypothetical protein